MTSKKECSVTFRGEATGSRSNVAADPQDGGRNPEEDVPAVWEVVLGRGAAIDSTGAAK